MSAVRGELYCGVELRDSCNNMRHFQRHFELEVEQVNKDLFTIFSYRTSPELPDGDQNGVHGAAAAVAHHRGILFGLRRRRHQR